MGADRIIYRGLYRGHRRQVHDCSAITHGLFYRGIVRYIADDQVQIGVTHRQITDLSGRQIIQYANLVAFAKQRFHKV